jgi:hypothetical protein
MEFSTILGSVRFFSLCSQIVPFRTPGSWWSWYWGRRGGADEVPVHVALAVHSAAPLWVVGPTVEHLEGDPASLEVVLHHVEGDRVVVDLGLPGGRPRCAGHERLRTDRTQTTGPGDHLRSALGPAWAGASGGEVLILRPTTLAVLVAGRTTPINAHLLGNGSTHIRDKRFRTGMAQALPQDPKNGRFPHVHVCPLSCAFVSIGEAVAIGGSDDQMTPVSDSAPAS